MRVIKSKLLFVATMLIWIAWYGESAFSDIILGKVEAPAFIGNYTAVRENDSELMIYYDKTESELGRIRVNTETGDVSLEDWSLPLEWNQLSYVGWLPSGNVIIQNSGGTMAFNRTGELKKFPELKKMRVTPLTANYHSFGSSPFRLIHAISKTTDETIQLAALISSNDESRVIFPDLSLFVIPSGGQPLIVGRPKAAKSVPEYSGSEWIIIGNHLSSHTFEKYTESGHYANTIATPFVGTIIPHGQGYGLVWICNKRNSLNHIRFDATTWSSVQTLIGLQNPMECEATAGFYFDDAQQVVCWQDEKGLFLATFDVASQQYNITSSIRDFVPHCISVAAIPVPGTQNFVIISAYYQSNPSEDVEGTFVIRVVLVDASKFEQLGSGTLY